MHESRCGVGCFGCARKESVRCTGCLTMEQPFWGGPCLVKACCEGKGHDHCGVCPDFPCEPYLAMGREQGYSPEPRLANCRLWASGKGR